MKNNLQLCVYLSHIDHVLNLNETLRTINRPNSELFEILDENVKTNQSSLNKLEKFFYQGQKLNLKDDVERIYFGQETCENLIPTIKEVQAALDFCAKEELPFTLVTPYVGPDKIDELAAIFEFLTEKDETVEVVVNDFGTLQLLTSKYKTLEPSLGRLMIKLKRDPRFSLSGYDIAKSEIGNLKKVEQNQLDAIQESSLDFPIYQQLLKGMNVQRLGVDSVPQGINPKAIKKWAFPVDLYWPWVYITSGRNCSVAAYTQPGKSFHPTEDSCELQCRQFEFKFTSDKKMLPSLQRGNAVWMNAESLYERLFQTGFSRLIYEPYIPV
jgi:hypothetical protein